MFPSFLDSEAKGTEIVAAVLDHKMFPSQNILYSIFITYHSFRCFAQQGDMLAIGKQFRIDAEKFLIGDQHSFFQNAASRDIDMISLHGFLSDGFEPFLLGPVGHLTGRDEIVILVVFFLLIKISQSLIEEILIHSASEDIVLHCLVTREMNKPRKK